MLKDLLINSMIKTSVVADYGFHVVLNPSVTRWQC